jgi:hypothetical protein
MMDGGHGMIGGHGMMGGQGMMRGQGTMGPGMMDGGQGMMGDAGMMGGGMMDMMGMGDQCPMLLPGTSVQAQDTKDGLAMTFTTTGDVAELRQRAHVMADHMNAHAGATGMHGGMMGADAGTGMMGGSMMGGTMPAMHAQVEDIDHGARLKMTPADPKKLGDMRDHMKEHAHMMNQTHGCSMMTDAGR